LFWHNLLVPEAAVSRPGAGAFMVHADYWLLNAGRLVSYALRPDTYCQIRLWFPVTVYHQEGIYA
jgi:hypothetical protein